MTETEITNPAPGLAAKIEPELLSKAETAHLLGVSQRTIDNLQATGRISYVKLTSKMVRYPRREILQNIHDMTVHSQGSKGGS